MKKAVWSILIIAILLIGGFFLYKSTNASPNSANPTIANGHVTTQTTNLDSGSVTSPTKVINLKAKRWTFTPGTITVKKGDHVKIIIDNTDTTHGIMIPDLGVSGIDSVEFTADKAGTYEFRCPTMCGEGHRDMKGTLIVE